MYVTRNIRHRWYFLTYFYIYVVGSTLHLSLMISLLPGYYRIPLFRLCILFSQKEKRPALGFIKLTFIHIKEYESMYVVVGDLNVLFSAMY